MTDSPSRASPPPVARRHLLHLRVGWCSMTVFVLLGLVLESLHAFRVPGYLDADHETRRLLWTLAHAHGTLLGLVNLALVPVLRLVPRWPERARRLASTALLAATVLMPVGFFLGGAGFQDGDPGPGILLVPVGGALLLLAVLLTALATLRWAAASPDSDAPRGRP